MAALRSPNNRCAKARVRGCALPSPSAHNRRTRSSGDDFAGEFDASYPGRLDPLFRTLNGFLIRAGDSPVLCSLAPTVCCDKMKSRSFIHRTVPYKGHGTRTGVSGPSESYLSKAPMRSHTEPVRCVDVAPQFI